MNEQRGVALAFLLWMLAALSLMVAGVVSVSMSDVKATGLQLDQARAEAAAAGAAHLTMRDLLAAQAEAEFNPRLVFTREYAVGESVATVQAIPIGGFVGLNQAPAELLQLVLQYIGGASPGAAEALAGAVVAARESGLFADDGAPAEAGAPAPFMVVEDLLRVPGMTRTVYDRVRFALHAQVTGAPGIDPLAAQALVLQALAQGDSALVDVVLEQRQDASAIDFASPPGLNQEFITTGGGGAYCLEINVQVAGGRQLRQRIWADMGGRTGSAFWRFTRAFPVEAANAAVAKSL